ncbi:ABC transporter permease [Paenibacillus sp. P96]|uniref:ABC transporter permease n=1 Tax=Paenibacillus zeirhizosphaerae TaxID=2987519 RepID=A0ABT9FNJ1_9BACL|nr:ABC transporter permease [Paenibacillus sp. P96]MDP4096302.1 ABC transporter permease [Paenibacillus sp. P96]
MTFRQFAFNNVSRNKRLYAAYFLSSLFTVMVFFTFSIFAYHPMLGPGHVHSNAATALAVSKWIIFVFSFFFVLYSMSAFLQSRKREFGLLMLQGMSIGQLRRMVFLENMLIGSAATVGGIGLGLVFAKAVLLLGENVLYIEDRLAFYFPLKAIGMTMASFLVLFILISFFISAVLRSGKLVTLIKGSKISKGEPKASVVLSLIVVLLIIISYTLSLLAKGMMVVMLLLPVVIMVCIATYLLFTQLSVYVIRLLKGRESIFWRKTNMLLLSDLAYRMKDNARTFFLVSIISTVAFCSIGALYGFRTVLLEPLMDSNPYLVSLNSTADNPEEDRQVQRIDEELSKAHIQAVPIETTLTYYQVEGDKRPVLIIGQSEYNRLANHLQAEQIQLQDGEVAAVGYWMSGGIMSKPQANSEYRLASGVTIQADQQVLSTVLPENKASLVLTDQAYAQLGQPDEARQLRVWIGAEGQPGAVEAGEKLADQFPYSDDYRFIAKDYQMMAVIKGYAPMLFIGLFVGIVFFVSAGSFLYFRLYSDLDDDKEKFRSISKLGLSERELTKVLTRQISLLFFAPIVVALIHGAVALTALSNMFAYSLFRESAVVLGVFFIIQVVYFIIVRFFYIKQVKAAL